MEEGGGVSRAHYHVRYAAKGVAVNRAVLTREKGCCLTRPMRPFQEDPKESYQLVENGHPMSPLKHSHHKIRLTLRSF